MMKFVFLVVLFTVSMVYLFRESTAMQKNGIQCGCHYPRIYRPVCGDDNVTYDNSGVIRCINMCNGTSIQFQRGPCGEESVTKRGMTITIA